MRFGVTRLILAGLVSIVAGYLLFLPIGLQSGYLTSLLPTFLLAGLGFRPRLRAAQHRGHERRRARGAGSRGRPAQHVLPVRRRARAGSHDGRDQRQHRR